MEPSTQCLPRLPFELYGRGGTFNQSARRQVQVYGRFADQVSTVDPPQLVRMGQQWHIKDPEHRERLWLVEMRVRSVVAFGELVPVLPSSAIENGANSRRGLIQLAIEIDNHPGGDILFMDSGQSIELYGTGIGAQLFGSDTYVEVAGNESTITTFNGTCENAIVGVAILPIEESKDCCRVQFTQWVNVPENTIVTTEVPPYARKLQIRQTNAGAAAAFWTLRTSPSLVIAVELPIGATRQSAVVDVGNATQVVSDTDVNDRLFQLVWTIEP